MSIVSNCIYSKTSNPLFESPTSSIATRGVGDRSDPWLHTASRVAAGVGLCQFEDWIADELSEGLLGDFSIYDTL